MNLREGSKDSSFSSSLSQSSPIFRRSLSGTSLEGFFSKPAKIPSARETPSSSFCSVVASEESFEDQLLEVPEEDVLHSKVDLFPQYHDVEGGVRTLTLGNTCDQVRQKKN